MVPKGRRIYVDATSLRRIDVDMTSSLRHVLAGKNCFLSGLAFILTGGNRMCLNSKVEDC